MQGMLRVNWEFGLDSEAALAPSLTISANASLESISNSERKWQRTEH